MISVKLYVDSTRIPPEGWLRARNIGEVVRTFKYTNVKSISIGDIKEGVPDLCRYLSNYGLWPNEVHFHLMNPIEHMNMEHEYQKYRRRNMNEQTGTVEKRDYVEEAKKEAMKILEDAAITGKEILESAEAKASEVIAAAGKVVKKMANSTIEVADNVQQDAMSWWNDLSEKERELWAFALGFTVGTIAIGTICAIWIATE